jgi:hypothetical protein
MTPENFERALRAFQRRAPFKPFTVALINGDRFQVDHPEALVFRHGIAVYIPPNLGMRIFDHEGANEFVDAAMPQEQGQS